MFSFEKKESIKEIYGAVHKEMLDFRSAGFRIGILYMTFVIVLIAWTITNKTLIGNYIILAWSLFFVISGYVFIYIHEVEKQFRYTADVINRIETTWGAFEIDYYTAGTKFQGEPLFPPKWADFGTKIWKEPMFFHTKILITLQIALYSVLSVLLWLRWV